MRMLLVLLMFTSPLAAQQVCVPEVEVGQFFDLRQQGVAIDKRNGLMWMRCTLGQQWRDGTCSQVYETFNWRDAHIAIADLNAGGGAFGHRDWRLPSLAELRTLVAPDCYYPALDILAFPLAPVTGYWSSTADPDYVSGKMLVHFLNGRTYMSNRSAVWTVRLVRGP